MTDERILAYLKENEENIQKFIESRQAQKLFDDGTAPMDNIVTAVITAVRDFISFPTEVEDTPEEEDFIAAIDDFVLGRFFDEYCTGYIREARKVQLEMARIS
jgi:hypothetical protein